MNSFAMIYTSFHNDAMLVLNQLLIITNIAKFIILP
nr:MAG TPA: hypothetical protein [Caudoviricetes sp.]